MAGDRQAAGHQVVPSPIFLLPGLITIALLWGKSRLLGLLETAVRLAGNPASYTFTLPLQAFGLSLLLALPGPLLLMTLAWQMNVQEDTTNFSQAVAIGLVTLSYRFYLLRFSACCWRRKGWLPVFFIGKKRRSVCFAESSGDTTFFCRHFYHPNSLFRQFSGRRQSYLGAAGFYRFPGPSRLLFLSCSPSQNRGVATFFSRTCQPVLVRLYPVFFYLLMLIPVVMIGLVLAGYVFAVGALVRCLINSVWVTFGLAVCHQLIERWLIQSSRRLALQKALNLRSQAKCGSGKGATRRR